MNKPASHPLQRLMKHQAAVAGIETLAGPFVVYEGRHGRRQTRLELEYERFQGCTQARLRTIHRQGMNLRSNGVAWTIQDHARPAELIAIIDAILDAVRPGARRVDSRGGVGRLLDRLLGNEHITEIPALSRQSLPFPQTLSAVIHRMAGELWVTLRYDRGRHRAMIHQTLPVDALKALRKHLTTEGR